MRLPRKADVRVEQAHEMYQQGAKLVEIANQLGLPEGTIRSWKNRQKWDCNVANGKNATLRSESAAVSQETTMRRELVHR